MQKQKRRVSQGVVFVAISSNNLVFMLLIFASLWHPQLRGAMLLFCVLEFCFNGVLLKYWLKAMKEAQQAESHYQEQRRGVVFIEADGRAHE